VVSCPGTDKKVENLTSCHEIGNIVYSPQNSKNSGQSADQMKVSSITLSQKQQWFDRE